MPKAELEEYLKKQSSGADEPVDKAALGYLRLWKSTRAAWKFQKVCFATFSRNLFYQMQKLFGLSISILNFMYV
mgnify:CR=1 FL=1